MKRLVAVLMAVCMLGAVPVRAEEMDKAARIAELEKQIAELQAELSELKGEAAEGAVLYEDDRVIIKYAGISGDEKKYEISFEVENLTSDKSLLIQNRETSLNGYMVDKVYCNITVAPGKKAKGGITVRDEWAQEYPMDELESIETKFYVADKEHMATDFVMSDPVIIK